jgi:hypothetical protein
MRVKRIDATGQGEVRAGGLNGRGGGVLSPTIERTEQVHENTRRRQEIAERQQAEYDWVYPLALSKLGPGWLLSGRTASDDHR